MAAKWLKLMVQLYQDHVKYMDITNYILSSQQVITAPVREVFPIGTMHYSH